MESLLRMKMENEENNVKLRKKLLIGELIFFPPHQIEFISEREPPDRSSGHCTPPRGQ